MPLPTIANKQESYKMFNTVAKTYDLLNRLLSFGIDNRWRRTLVESLPAGKNLSVLDLATGTADLALALAMSPKVKKVVGIDLSEKMLAIGKTKCERSPHQEKINLRIGDGTKIPFSDRSFDVVTISFGIRNFSSALTSLKEIRRVLKPKGQVLILEFALPKSPLIKFFYLLYFRHILPTIGGLISKNKAAYSYLNNSVENFPAGVEFLKLMEEAQLKNCSATDLTFGIANLYSGVKFEGE